MAIAIRTHIEGLAASIAKLDSVEKKLRTKILRKAMGQAGKLVLWAAKAKARRVTGLLRRSLGRKVKLFKNGVAIAIVGPRVGFEQEVQRGGRTVMSKPTKYSHLVEKGTKHSKPQPFLRPAGEEQKGIVESAIGNTIANGIEDAAR